MSNYNEEPDHLTWISQQEFMRDFFTFSIGIGEKRWVFEGVNYKFKLIMWRCSSVNQVDLGLAIKEHLGIYTFHRYGDPELWVTFLERFLHEHRGD